MKLKSVDFKRAVPVLILFGFALFYGFSTRFHPLVTGGYGHDAGIFAYVGMAMKEGRVLYTEVWENKGPLLYFINLLGISINYYHGIYLLELSALFFTLFFMYKTANLYCNKTIALISAVFASVPLTVTLEGGNLSEEYALPFMAWCLYLAAKFIKQDCNLKKIELFAVGVTIGAVFMLRLNILALQFCLVLAVIICLITRKEFKKLGTVFTFAILGFLTILAPFIIYLVKNDALEACINTAYLGTVSSFESMSNINRLQNVFSMISDFKSSGSLYLIVLFIITIPFALFKKIKFFENNKRIYPIIWACYGALFLNLFANSISGVRHMHYFITFIPIILIPAMLVFGSIFKILNDYCLEKYRQKKFVSKAISSGVALLLCIEALNTFTLSLTQNVGDLASRNIQLMVNYILENTDVDDTIQTIGGQSAVTAYYRTNRLSASSYSYYANGLFSEKSKYEFANTIAEDLYTNKPKLIISDYEPKFQDFQNHISNSVKWTEMIENDYEKIENDFGCIIYKLK